MGARGKLRLSIVPDEDSLDTAAQTAPKIAPKKSAAVEGNENLSALWDEIVPELDATGLVAPSDGPAIELALRHFLLARMASEDVTSITVEDRDGDVRKNPAEAVFRAESDMFLRYAGQLGMTFVSRARTPAGAGADGGDANPFESPL